MTTNDSIDVEFRYTPDEYSRAVRRHFRSAFNVRLDIVGAVVSCGVGICVLWTTPYVVLGWVSLAAGLTLLGMVTYALLLMPKMMYHAEPKLKEEYRISFSDEDIRFTTRGIDSVLQWSVYHSWLRDDEFYILYHGKRNLTVVPRRVLSTADADQRFEKLLRSKISERPLHGN
ncbi:MAG TPA: hypothetical protein DD670_04340 [Planctomycetaceae bacterium]|nr:hypothetical protein [Planctomycetaceae bacterium]